MSSKSRHRQHDNPMQLFCDAKTEIDKIFENLSHCVDELLDIKDIAQPSSRQYCTTWPSSYESAMRQYHYEQEKFLHEPEDSDFSHKMKYHISAVRKSLALDQMKVCFFGRTTNGKSSVINAMLAKNIVPVGVGHTTSCFIQVKGCPEDDGFLCRYGSKERHSINSVTELTSALSKTKLEENSLLRIEWPKAKCDFLDENIVFLDSPGIDYTEDLDKYIDEYCMDADVFVLVVNAESALSRTEKDFFYKVGEKFVRPNIFILHNRWNLCMNAANACEVQAQHMERSVEFLNSITRTEESRNRVFFVSAKETMTSRQGRKNRSSRKKKTQRSQKVQDVLDEFKRFEATLKECISKSAVKTKFGRYAEDREDKLNAFLRILAKIDNDILRQSEEDYENKLKSRRTIDYYRKDCSKKKRELENLQKKERALQVGTAIAAVAGSMIARPAVRLAVTAVTAGLGYGIYKVLTSTDQSEGVLGQASTLNADQLERCITKIETEIHEEEKKIELSERNLRKLQTVSQTVYDIRMKLEGIREELNKFKEHFLS